ncbi:MAG: hypothetical protein ACKO3K_11065 [Cuspidothrix sp.]
MIKKIQEILKLLLSLLILLPFFGLTIRCLWYLVRLFNSVEPPVQAAIITAFVGFASLIISNFYTRQREINLKLRDKKVEVYSKLIESWIQTFLNVSLKSKNNNNYHVNDLTNDVDLQDFTKTLKEITDDLILWGSDEIIKNYCDLQKTLPNENSSEIVKTVGLINFGKFMLCIRKDLGHSNKGIDEYDLMSLFITDIDNFRVSKSQIDELIKAIKKGDKIE